MFKCVKCGGNMYRVYSGYRCYNCANKIELDKEEHKVCSSDKEQIYIIKGEKK